MNIIPQNLSILNMLDCKDEFSTAAWCAASMKLDVFQFVAVAPVTLETTFGTSRVIKHFICEKMKK